MNRNGAEMGTLSRSNSYGTLIMVQYPGVTFVVMNTAGIQIVLKSRNTTSNIAGKENSVPIDVTDYMFTCNKLFLYISVLLQNV